MIVAFCGKVRSAARVPGADWVGGEVSSGHSGQNLSLKEATPMSDSSVETRRKLLGLAAAGAGLGAATALSLEAQAGTPSLFASWVHGHNVVFERTIRAPSRNAVATTFVAKGPFSDTSMTYYDGDVLLILGTGAPAVAVSRLAEGARFIVFDRGTADNPQSGSFWCHYAVPTPVIVGGQRATLS